MNPTNEMMMNQVLGSPSIRDFCYVLNYFLIKSFACSLVESFLIESQYS